MKRLLVFALALACLFAFGALAEEVADDVAAEDEVIVAGQVDEEITTVEQNLDDAALNEETPSKEEPTTEEPTTEEATTEEPTGEEPTEEEPTVEEPTAEEPTAEEPAAEEPTAEEPTAEEPVKDEDEAEGVETVAEEAVVADAVDECEAEADESVEALPELPTAMDLTYTGEPQALVSDPGEGAFLYSLDGENYSAEIPTAINAGEYTVYYKPATDAEEIEEAEDLDATDSLTVTIAKADVTLIPPIAFNAED